MQIIFLAILYLSAVLWYNSTLLYHMVEFADIKIVIDSLSGIASIIAITSVLIAWHRSSGKPLKPKRIVIWTGLQEPPKYFIGLKNKRDYSVKISKIKCYRKKTYLVSDIPNEPLECLTTFSSNDLLVEKDLEDFEIQPKGLCFLKVNGYDLTEKPHKVIILLDTSHGDILLKSSKLEFFQRGNVHTSSQDDLQTYDSWFKAYPNYSFKKLKRRLK